MRFTSILQEKESEAAAFMKRKKVLVVDDFVNFRITMRNMLATLGVEHPDEAYNGEDAVRKMAAKRFDVVFCDYNLGTGKDGQQVMEEARERHLIGYSTAFMMVTAENTIDMIMGVAEYEPDDYLVKPFTKQTLEKKIITIFEKKETLTDVIKAMDDFDYQKALTLCNEKIAGTPKHLAELFRLKGEILIRIGDYSKAEQYFKEIATKGKLPWTMLGMGKCRYMIGDYEKAQYIFEELIRTNDKIMAAYDWLTKTQEKLGNNSDAQRTLMKAVALSPKALVRQKELGDLAHRNGDLRTAEAVYHIVVKRGKNSYYKKPSDYTTLAKILAEENAHKNSLTVLGDAAKEFGDNPQAALEIALTESMVYTKMNRPEDARKSINKVMKTIRSSNADVSPDVEIDLARALILNGEEEKGKELVRRLVQSNHENNALIGQAKTMFEEIGKADEGRALLDTAVQEVINLNNQGVKLVQQGDLETARIYFESAVNKLPGNKIINANAAYAFMLYMKKNKAEPELLKKTRDNLEQVYNLDPNYADLPRLLAIYREFTKEPLPWLTSTL